MIVCTVYNPRFPEFLQQQLSVMGISAVNSIITAEGTIIVMMFITTP